MGFKLKEGPDLGRAILAPGGHLAASGHISGCHTWGGAGRLLHTHGALPGPETPQRRGGSAVEVSGPELPNAPVPQVRRLSLSAQLARGRAKL